LNAKIKIKQKGRVGSMFVSGSEGKFAILEWVAKEHCLEKTIFELFILRLENIFM
jgi:hypothetical protein